jgi:bloom syndrome protein
MAFFTNAILFSVLFVLYLLNILQFQVIHNAIEKYNCTYSQQIKQLKPLQYKAIQSILTGRDVLCCLPTGYGKSLLYEILPCLFVDSFIVVIEPLSIIIKQQEEKLGRSAASLKKGKYNENGVQFLFCHPEDIVDNKAFIDVACSENFQKKKLFLVVDEAHCIIDWGDDFRPKFKQIAELRAVMDCQVIALSATVTKLGQEAIKSNLLMKYCETVSTSPAKENISFIKVKRPSPHAKGNTANTPYDYIFKPVLEELKIKLGSFPITIIYCKSMQWIGYCYELARRYLENNFYEEVDS